MGVRLVDVASVIRSKNAGPCELTLDIIFEDRAWYERVKAAGAIDRALIARLYRVPEADVDLGCPLRPGRRHQGHLPPPARLGRRRRDRRLRGAAARAAARPRAGGDRANPGGNDHGNAPPGRGPARASLAADRRHRPARRRGALDRVPEARPRHGGAGRRPRRLRQPGAGLRPAGADQGAERPRAAFAPIFAMGFVGMTLGTMVGGYFGDRVGRRLSLIGAVVLFALATGATASRTTSWRSASAAPSPASAWAPPCRTRRRCSPSTRPSSAAAWR